jgi:hypothetical protein
MNEEEAEEESQPLPKNHSRRLSFLDDVIFVLWEMLLMLTKTN